jgi:xanthine/uracil/vitamin C permease (AzgA family)
VNLITYFRIAEVKKFVEFHVHSGYTPSWRTALGKVILASFGFTIAAYSQNEWWLQINLFCQSQMFEL